MAEFKIADLSNNLDIFNQYVTERTSDMANLSMSGIMVNDPRLNVLASAGGNLVSMPFYQDLTGSSEVLSDSSSLTVNKIGTDKDVARLHARGKAWGVNDLAAALSGDDPLMAIGNLVAGYWTRDREQTLIKSLSGVFADNVANDSSDMVNDVAIEDGSKAATTNLFSGDAFIDAELTFGDVIGNVTGIAVHPVVYAKMRKLGLIDFLPEQDAPAQIPLYMGKRVIVSRHCPRVAGGTSGFKYTTYLFGAGSVALGDGGAPVPTETDRDSLAGSDILITRNHFLMHPLGVKWTESSVAGQFPTDAECAAAGNWDRVYERENVRIASLVTNG